VKTRRRRKAGRTARAAPPGLQTSELGVGPCRYLILSFPLAGRRDPRADDAEAEERALTAAEHEVLELLLAGRTNAEIARRRRTAPRTVANQLGSIYRKLRVGGRRQLLALLAPRP